LIKAAEAYRTYTTNPSIELESRGQVIESSADSGATLILGFASLLDTIGIKTNKKKNPGGRLDGGPVVVIFKY